MKPSIRLAITTSLDLVALGCLIAFAALLWWPAILPIVTGAALATSRRFGQ